MGTVKIGPWDVVDPSPRDEDLMRDARARSTFRWHDALPYRLTVHFRGRTSMPKIPGSDGYSRGYAYGRTILIARGLPTEESIYIALHETAHHLRLTSKQMLGIMELLRPRVRKLPDAADTPEKRKRIRLRFRGVEYWYRPHECHCDQHVIRFTEPRVKSPYGYGRSIPDGRPAQKYREIVMSDPKVTLPDEQDEVEQEPPTPEPEPPEQEPGPTAEELTSRIDDAVAILQGESEEDAEQGTPG